MVVQTVAVSMEDRMTHSYIAVETGTVEHFGQWPSPVVSTCSSVHWALEISGDGLLDFVHLRPETSPSLFSTLYLQALV